MPVLRHRGSRLRSLLLVAGVVASSVAGVTLQASSASAAVVSGSATLQLPANHQVGLFEDLQYLSGSALSQRLDQYAALGLRWARFQMIWGAVQQGGPGSYDWAPYDALVQGLVSRGIEPLVVVDTSPTWDRVSGCSAGLTCAPADPAAYAAFVAAAAARYAPMGVHAWEVWNEPNNDVFWAPSPNPGFYASMLRATYTAVKAVDPSATVVTGGLAPAVDSGGAQPTQVAPVEFLSDLYNDGAGGYFDAVGWHPYTYPAMPGVDDPGSAWFQMYGTSTSVRSLMVAHGDGAKKVWVTEFGAPTGGPGGQPVTEAQQASTFSVGMALWSSYSWAGPFIGYQYQDRGSDPSTVENFFGLTDVAGNPKPAFYAVQAGIAVLSSDG